MGLYLRFARMSDQMTQPFCFRPQSSTFYEQGPRTALNKDSLKQPERPTTGDGPRKYGPFSLEGV